MEKSIGQARWYTHVIQLLESRGRRITSWSTAQAKLARPCLKNKIQKNSWDYGSSGRATCLAYMGLWVQSPVLQKQNKQQKPNRVKLHTL
jgi:hypothetical protein